MSAEREAKIGANKPILDMCSKVGADLYRAKRAKDVYLWIADHAKTINNAHHGKSFGTIQEFALTEMFVAIGRAHDDLKYESTNCLKQILINLKTAPLVEREALAKFVGDDSKRWQDLSDYKFRDEAIAYIERTRPTFSSSKELKNVLQVRHEQVAHSAQSPTVSKATFADVETCIQWGERFIGMVGRAFGSHVFMYEGHEFFGDYEIKSTLTSFKRLAHDANIVRDKHFDEIAEAINAYTSSEKKGG